MWLYEFLNCALRVALLTGRVSVIGLSGVDVERSLLTMNAEEAKVGCFQMVLVLLLGINYVIVAMSHALPVFHNYTPKFYCQVRGSMKGDRKKL